MVVDVVNAAPEVVDRAVIGEGVAAPVATFVAYAAVSKTIVDAPVEADVRTPIAGVEVEAAAFIGPVGGGPEEPCAGREYPGSGDPVVAFGTVSPVAGGPDVAVAWADGLRVHGQRGRPEGDRDSYLRRERGGYGQRGCEKQRSDSGLEGDGHESLCWQTRERYLPDVSMCVDTGFRCMLRIV